MLLLFKPAICTLPKFFFLFCLAVLAPLNSVRLIKPIHQSIIVNGKDLCCLDPSCLDPSRRQPSCDGSGCGCMENKFEQRTVGPSSNHLRWDGTLYHTVANRKYVMIFTRAIGLDPFVPFCRVPSSSIFRSSSEMSNRDYLDVYLSIITLCIARLLQQSNTQNKPQTFDLQFVIFNSLA